MDFFQSREAIGSVEAWPGDKVVKKYFLIVGLVIWGISAFAHKGESHKQMEAPTVSHSDITADQLKAINDDYTKNVKPIFQNSCFDCHSQTPRLPWYYKVPLVQGMIERDMKEAKEHLDMSNGFPFVGHGSPLDDLRSIRDSVKENGMPPFRYRIMHQGSALSESEVKAVIDWIERSEKKLTEK